MVQLKTYKDEAVLNNLLRRCEVKAVNKLDASIIY